MSRPLYLDCEFNGHNGYLISIALYDPLENKNFYEVDDFWAKAVKYRHSLQNVYSTGVNKWVLENVIPKLNKKGVEENIIIANLTNYLYEFDIKDLIIYADWPDDFAHLMKLLRIMDTTNNAPIKIVPNLKFELITTPDKFVSVLPHNALEDAKALYLNHLEGLKNV
jgi:hypothetical protein